jgi:probable phosphoglycerate mutase
MRRLLVLRHGQTAWNLEGRWQGWLDIPLDDVGRAQARARAVQLAAAATGFAAVASSPLARALETATIVAGRLGIEGVRTYPGLRERNGGDWQGRTTADINARWPGELAAMRRGEMDAPPGGETTVEMMDRLDGALAAIDSTTRDGPIVVVTHGGIARALVSRTGTAESPALFANVGGMWIDYDNGEIRAGDPLPRLDHGPAAPEGPLPTAPEIVAAEHASGNSEAPAN